MSDYLPHLPLPWSTGENDTLPNRDNGRCYPPFCALPTPTTAGTIGWHFFCYYVMMAVRRFAMLPRRR